MELSALPMVSALWFGILTSISPCPLATNIAATTFIGRQIETRYGTLVAGAAYTGGRALAYILICFIIVAGLFSIPGVSMFLQQYMNKLLGPVLIVVGLLIADIIPLRLPAWGDGNSAFIRRLSNGGTIGAIFLGFIFALSFCPVSAALFFGSVIPLALKFESGIWLPLWYGIGTALPVIGFALLLSYGTRAAAAFIKGLTFMERYLRRLTAAVFIGIGIYFTVTYTFGAAI
ncbi:MAG TPA: aromatic aminobenezylarsenical efflux permease ArsG family transporter [Desulfosalsimonadaceae bacterium]|nr:aromatic aminobenezylarsenical efflux permease ArsG family transporter [Desulfosalsimonadaceae bacterium]